MLLHSQQIDVSYFAAGILAHLASEGEKAWTETGVEVSWHQALSNLGKHTGPKPVIL